MLDTYSIDYKDNEKYFIRDTFDKQFSPREIEEIIKGEGLGK